MTSIFHVQIETPDDESRRNEIDPALRDAIGHALEDLEFDPDLIHVTHSVKCVAVEVAQEVDS